MEETQIASSLEFDVLGFEVCHAVKPDPKRGAELISITYIQPDSERDRRYSIYRENFWCPWFRRHLLQNLVKNRHWTTGWGGLLSSASQKWFEHRYFPHDCKLVFNFGENIVETSELIQILKSLCDRYLNARLAGKGQDINWENKHKLARQEFLAVRSRPQKDAFRKYFYETLCSQVTPVLLKKGISNEEYDALSKEEKQQQAEQQNAEKIRQMLLIAEALDKDTETVRGLTMLALASNFQFADRSGSSTENSAE
jgi:CRISPR-associated protein Cmx8